MSKLISILFGFFVILFHQQLANYYRSFGRNKITPVKWRYTEEVVIIAGIMLIMIGIISFLNK